MLFRSLRLARLVRAQDPAFQDVGSLEGHHPPGQDWHFFARLGVATDALVLGAYMEGREGGQLDGFTPDDRLADLVEHSFDEFGRLRPRQADLSVHGFRQVGARKCLSPHAVQPSRKNGF